MNNFKIYLEGDLFGFETLEKTRNDKNLSDSDDNLPITIFSIQWLMDSLARKKLNNIKANHDFIDEIYWGEKKKGAIRVRLTPNTSIYIERLISDGHGNPIWICKKLFKIDQEDYRGKEDLVASEIFDEVKTIHNEDLDAAKSGWKDLALLVNKMVQRVRTASGGIFMYQDVKKVSPDYYIIWFAISGTGTGKLLSPRRGSGTTPEATIDVAYDNMRGLIHVILSTVSSGEEGLSWEIDIPYLDSFYAPSQSRDEIIDSVVTALKYY